MPGYDHPLVRISSRQAVLTHFVLLHLCSTGYVPSLTPSNIIHVVSNLTSHIRQSVLGGVDRERSHDIESHPVDLVDLKGKKKMVNPDWLAAAGKMEGDVKQDQGHWWRLWDVSANCVDIGTLHSQSKPAQHGDPKHR